MHLNVARAVEELKFAFPSSIVTNSEDGQGGTFFFVESVEIGNFYIPSVSWMGGHITALYPYADIYPVFIDANVRRADGREFEVPITRGHTFVERPAIQISRRNSMVQSSPQTALTKLLKIIQFLRELK